MLLVGAVAYEQEWAEFQAIQGVRNGDIPQAFKEMWILSKNTIRRSQPTS